MNQSPDNQDRAEWAEAALVAFTTNVNYGRTPADLDDGDRADAVADLICDLLHYAEQQGFDPEALLAQAKINFEFERGGNR